MSETIRVATFVDTETNIRHTAMPVDEPGSGHYLLVTGLDGDGVPTYEQTVEFRHDQERRERNARTKPMRVNARFLRYLEAQGLARDLRFHDLEV